MYYATGLPGWMRFGFSPGWVGRSPTGLPPGATYLLTGMWPTPQAQAYWQALQAGQVPFPAWGAVPFAAPTGVPPTPGFWPGWMPQMPPEQELQFLRNQAQMIKQQLEQINNRIAELEKQG